MPLYSEPAGGESFGQVEAADYEVRNMLSKQGAEAEAVHEEAPHA